MEDLINKLKNSKLKIVEKATGIPYDRMYKWIKGEGKPKSEDFDKLVRYFNGDGESSNKSVPYYDGDVTGSIVGSFDDIREEPAFYVDFKPFNDCTAYVPIYGDSMYPRFASGERIAVKQVANKELIQWGEAHLVITNSEANNMKTVKTIHPNEKDDSTVILRASNPNYKGDTVVPKSCILQLFIVKGKVRIDQL